MQFSSKMGPTEQYLPLIKILTSCIELVEPKPDPNITSIWQYVGWEWPLEHCPCPHDMFQNLDGCPCLLAFRSNWSRRHCALSLHTYFNYLVMAGPMYTNNCMVSLSRKIPFVFIYIKKKYYFYVFLNRKTL